MDASNVWGLQEGFMRASWGPCLQKHQTTQTFSRPRSVSFLSHVVDTTQRTPKATLDRMAFSTWSQGNQGQGGWDRNLRHFQDTHISLKSYSLLTRNLPWRNWSIHVEIASYGLRCAVFRPPYPQQELCARYMAYSLGSNGSKFHFVARRRRPIGTSMKVGRRRHALPSGNQPLAA